VKRACQFLIVQRYLEGKHSELVLGVLTKGVLGRGHVGGVARRSTRTWQARRSAREEGARKGASEGGARKSASGGSKG